MVQSLQGSALAALDADPWISEELLRYDERRMASVGTATTPSSPLPDEPFVTCWRGWAEQARQQGVFETLARHLPQLRFPIASGISTTEGYRAATLQGASSDEVPEATGLHLDAPDQLDLVLHPSSAGTVPLLITRHRGDFVTLTRALAKRNEPVDIPDGQGAAMISGYNNWTRIHQLRDAWMAQTPEQRTESSWPAAFARIRKQPSRFRDRLIILSDGPYSAVPAADLGLGNEAWRAQSLIIRREHECTHYLTQRLYGSAQNHLLDELLADYAGLMAATGRFRAAWFLRFLGLEGEGVTSTTRDTGRLALYRGQPALSDAAFIALQTLVRRAALNVERIDQSLRARRNKDVEPTEMIRALAHHSLIALAAPETPDRLLDTLG